MQCKGVIAGIALALAISHGAGAEVPPSPVSASLDCPVWVAAVFPSTSGATVAIALRTSGTNLVASGGVLRLYHGPTAYDAPFATAALAAENGPLDGASPIVVRVAAPIDGAYVAKLGGKECAPYHPWNTAIATPDGAQAFVQKIAGAAPIDATASGVPPCTTADRLPSEVSHVRPDFSRVAVNLSQREVRVTVDVLVAPDGHVADTKVLESVGPEIDHAVVDAAQRNRYRAGTFRCQPTLDTVTEIYQITKF